MERHKQVYMNQVSREEAAGAEGAGYLSKGVSEMMMKRLEEARAQDLQQWTSSSSAWREQDECGQNGKRADEGANSKGDRVFDAAVEAGR
uniref:Uncharacterized protein n=1 Tax=Kalanchoe fedtschenkoi TaxID=63787 RepID=A0A7N1A4T3_KALFE